MTRASVRTLVARCSTELTSRRVGESLQSHNAPTLVRLHERADLLTLSRSTQSKAPRHQERRRHDLGVEFDEGCSMSPSGS